MNIFSIKEDKVEPRLKVKLTVTSYMTKGGFELKKSLYFYKNPNPEHLIDCFRECAEVNGLYTINNLHLLDDGIYELIVKNLSYDWETNTPDDCEFELIKWRD